MRRLTIGSAVAMLLLPCAAWAQYGGDTTTTAPAGPTTTTAPPGATDLSDTGTTTVEPGELITGSVNGAQPGSGYNVTFESEPVEIDSGNADVNGNIVFTGRVPSDAAAGDHTVRLRYTDSAGAAAEETWAVRVVAAGESTALAATGASGIGDTLRTAGLVLVAGLALVTIAVQRQKRRLATRESVGV